MASFSAYLEMGGSRYPLTYYDLYIHQQTDVLGRPASLTQGGTITCELHSPDQRDNVLTDWMLSPTRQHDGFVHLYREDTKSKLKTISFFNAYCVDMGVHFSASGSGPMLTSIVISPQRVAVGAVVHDNNWPVESHGAGITYAQSTVEHEPGLLSDIAHTVLDIAGQVPVIGELADGANALFYLAEGNKTDAALSAAAMIPVAGNVVGATKIGRRALKVINNIKGLKSLKTRVAKGLKKIDGYITGTHEALVNAGKKDSHHIIQDAAMREIPGYSRQKAPTIQLSGPSTKIGSPHYNATQAQRRKGGGTYGAERKHAYRALREAGVPKETAKKVIRKADKYFTKLGVAPSTPTRIPGNRKK